MQKYILSFCFSNFIIFINQETLKEIKEAEETKAGPWLSPSNIHYFKIEPHFP